MSPDCARLDRHGRLRLRASRAAGADERVVQRHRVHVARPDEKRVGGVRCSLIAVAAALHHQPQIVGSREIDRGDDILRRLGGDGVDARLRRPRPDPAERLGEPDLVAEIVGILELLEHLLAVGVGRSADAVGERRAHLDEASLHVVIELIPARFRRPCRIAETDARLRLGRSRGAARETAHERKCRGDLKQAPPTQSLRHFAAPWPPDGRFSSRLAGAVSRRPGALDLGDERVGQFDFGRGGASPGNMNAKLGEPVELESQALRKVGREQRRRDGDDEKAGAGRAIARE